ncbi:MAG: EamA family transporter [Bacillota bacterium]|nr:EamA family transporter [Bacillota bacterium]
MKKNNFLGAVFLALAASIWGSMYVVSKYVLNFIPPITLVWSRYAVGFIVLFIILKLVQRKSNKTPVPITKRDWLLIIWIGFIGYFISITLQFAGTKLSDAHTASLITSATPAFIVVFAYFVLKEKFTLSKIIALILSTLGVVVIVGWNIQVGSYFLGSITLIGAALTWALLTVYAKLASNSQSSLVITTYGIMFALIFTTPLMLWEIRTSSIFIGSKLIILGVIYLGTVSTAGAFFLWNKGMELMDAGIGSILFFLQPLVGSFLGWLLLNEHLTLNFFIGGAFILIGVFMATVKN